MFPGKGAVGKSKRPGVLDAATERVAVAFPFRNGEARDADGGPGGVDLEHSAPISFPLIVSSLAPGPSIVTSWLISESPLVKNDRLPVQRRIEVTGNPLTSTEIASRSEPGPLSLTLVTKGGWASNAPMSTMSSKIRVRPRSSVTRVRLGHQRSEALIPPSIAGLPASNPNV